MKPLVGLALVPARNSLILIGLMFLMFSVAVCDCVPVLPGLRHWALPTMSPLKAPDPDVTLKVALTLAPGATGCVKLTVLLEVPTAMAVHPCLSTETLNFTFETGDPVVFVNV